MTEPKRILQSAGSDDELALLRSASLDGPSDRVVKQTLTAMGIAGATMTASTTAGAAAKAMGASLPPAAAKASGLTVLVKWVGVAGFAALAGWGGLSMLGADPPKEQPVAAAATTTTPQQREVPAIEAAGSERVAPRDADVSHVPNAPAPPATTARADAKRPVAAPVLDAPPPPAEPARKPSLGEEVAALDDARKRMDEDPEAALSKLEAYRSSFKGGALAQEAEVLRIEALARAGKHNAARSAASSFLAAHPSSPLAARVRRVLQPPSKTPAE